MAERNWKEITVEDDSTVWDKILPLEGSFEKVENDVGPNKANLYTIKKEDGEEIKVWGSKVLDDKLMGVPKGVFVKLEYEGKVKGKSGNEYHSYKVFMDLDSEADASDVAPEDVPEFDK